MKTEDAVLESLRSNRARRVSGGDLARQLGLSRAAVWKAVERLRELGYGVEAHSHAGYRLTSVPDRIYAEEILWGLGTETIGRTVHAYEKLDSTNDTAWKLAENGAPEGTIVVAEKQEKGRGRLGRRWVSPKGKNLLCSIVLRPNLPPDGIQRITLAAAVSAAKTVRAAAGVPAAIKWPNDLVFKGRKLAGILTEMSAEADRVRFCILGIGFNLNADPHQLPPQAASLKSITGRPVDRVEFARIFLRAFEEDYRRVTDTLASADGRTHLTEVWARYAETPGKRVSIRIAGRRVEGQALSIDSSGALWIRTDDGLQERVLSGDLEERG